MAGVAALHFANLLEQAKGSYREVLRSRAGANSAENKGGAFNEALLVALRGSTAVTVQPVSEPGRVDESYVPVAGLHSFPDITLQNLIGLARNKAAQASSREGETGIAGEYGGEQNLHARIEEVLGHLAEISRYSAMAGWA